MKRRVGIASLLGLALSACATTAAPAATAETIVAPTPTPPPMPAPQAEVAPVAASVVAEPTSCEIFYDRALAVYSRDACVQADASEPFFSQPNVVRMPLREDFLRQCARYPEDFLGKTDNDHDAFMRVWFSAGFRTTNPAVDIFMASIEGGPAATEERFSRVAAALDIDGDNSTDDVAIHVGCNDGPRYECRSFLFVSGDDGYRYVGAVDALVVSSTRRVNGFRELIGFLPEGAERPGFDGASLSLSEESARAIAWIWRYEGDRYVRKERDRYNGNMRAGREEVRSDFMPSAIDDELPRLYHASACDDLWRQRVAKRNVCHLNDDTSREAFIANCSARRPAERTCLESLSATTQACDARL